MVAEKKSNDVIAKTKIAQKISTKIKVLLGLVMLLSVGGMFTLLTLEIDNIENLRLFKTTYYTEKDDSLIKEFIQAVKNKNLVSIKLSDGLEVETYLDDNQDYLFRFSEEINPVKTDIFVKNNAQETDDLLKKLEHFVQHPEVQKTSLSKIEFNTKNTNQLKQIIIDDAQGTPPANKGCSCGNNLVLCIFPSINMCASGGAGTNIGCFLNDTLIESKEGFKKIQDIEIGDLVNSYDIYNNKMVFSEVVNIFQKESKQYLNINDSLKVTAQHPFWVDNQWKKASDIEINDSLFLNDKSFEKVKSIETVREKVKVYNLQVEGYNNYFANNVLVHNKSLWGGYVTNIELKISITF